MRNILCLFVLLLCLSVAKAGDCYSPTYAAVPWMQTYTPLYSGYYNSYPYNYSPYTTAPYDWYGTQEYGGRLWPAGYYRQTPVGWYQLGHGIQYGIPIVKVPTAVVLPAKKQWSIPVADWPVANKGKPLSEQEIATLKELLERYYDQQQKKKEAAAEPSVDPR